jgi:hypothetical protein
MAVKERVPRKGRTEKGQKSTRYERGIALALERFDSIWRVAPWTWEIPSCSGPRRYTANLKTGECSCPDRPPEGEECKHTVAARYVKAKTATCVGCGERFRHRELLEVTEDHDSLTWFPGDLLCIAECAGNHGVL